MTTPYPSTATTIKLTRPLMTTQGELAELHLKEPTVRDKLLHEKSKGGPLEKEVALIASLCGIEPAEIYTLSAYDYKQLGEALNTFLLPPEERSNPD